MAAWVEAVSWSPSGESLGVASHDGVVKVYEFLGEEPKERKI